MAPCLVDGDGNRVRQVEAAHPRPHRNPEPRGRSKLRENRVGKPRRFADEYERGFNQAREIAVRVARATAVPLAAPLARISAGAPQTTLPWAERRRNVRGAFAVRGDVRGARIALVDDVMTTGATLAEAARTLVRAGALSVECWVVARTLPP